MKSRGFTLVELLVLISIIPFLSSTVLARLNTARKKANDTRRLADMKQLQIALEGYYNETGSYIPTGNGWNGSCNYSGYTYDGYTSFSGILQPLVNKKLISSIPKDPINLNCITYEYFSNNTLSGEAARWNCNGEPLYNFAYVIKFGTEGGVQFPLPTLYDQTYPRNNPKTYCILGPRVQ